MKRYIKASLNLDFWQVALSSINGGKGEKLTQRLKSLIAEIPVGRYILTLGNRGYNSGYYKVDAEHLKRLYDGGLDKVSGYWNTDQDYFVLPAEFKPSGRINYDDVVVKVYEISESDDEIYSGLEDYDPMKNEDWTYCKTLGMYYFIDYFKHKIYVKWSIG